MVELANLQSSSWLPFEDFLSTCPGIPISAPALAFEPSQAVRRAAAVLAAAAESNLAAKALEGPTEMTRIRVGREAGALELVVRTRELRMRFRGLLSFRFPGAVYFILGSALKAWKNNRAAGQIRLRSADGSADPLFSDGGNGVLFDPSDERYDRARDAESKV